MCVFIILGEVLYKIEKTLTERLTETPQRSKHFKQQLLEEHLYIDVNDGYNVLNVQPKNDGGQRMLNQAFDTLSVDRHKVALGNGIKKDNPDRKSRMQR